MTFREIIRSLNWWSVTAVLFVICMFGLIASPAWADPFALACGFTAIVAAIFSLKE